MNLKSWTSNSDALQADAWEGVLDTEPITKVLGLRWEPSTYMLSFARRDFPILTNITKRLILKYSSQTHMINQFWKRWKTEYLTALREHHRTTGSNSQTIRVGDIVQVHDDCPRARWKLAVVKELMTAKDGLARAAKIRTSNGLYTARPIVKLYPLEVLHDNQRDCE